MTELFDVDTRTFEGSLGAWTGAIDRAAVAHSGAWGGHLPPGPSVVATTPQGAGAYLLLPPAGVVTFGGWFSTSFQPTGHLVDLDVVFVDAGDHDMTAAAEQFTLAATGVWEHFETTRDVPAGAARAYAFVQVHPTGGGTHHYMDDLSLDFVEADVGFIVGSVAI